MCRKVVFSVQFVFNAQNGMREVRTRSRRTVATVDPVEANEH
jgi:hypothetical protein